MKLKNNDKLKGFESILYNPNTIIVILVIIIALIMMLNIYIIKSHKIYTFGGFGESLSISNGTIDINHDINHFVGGNIIYTGKNETLTKYKVGYYICNKDKYKKIIEVGNSELGDEEVNIKNLVEYQSFSFTESHRVAKNLSKNNIKDINKLCFKIEGLTKKNKKIEIKIPMSLTKISK